MAVNPLDPPLLTADIPGVGGQIKHYPEDFEVEEIPSYEPSGTGEHLFLWLEKRDVGPEYLARTVAQRVGVPVGAIGVAGLKDRRAVTRQWVSLPQEAEPRLARIDGDGIRVLGVHRHGNKLKTGHLRGNKFRVLIRHVDTSQTAALDAILHRLRSEGLPNYYGPQRFGRDQSTLELGWRCLAGTASRRIRPFLFKFALSAVQSFLFNDYLGRRLADGLWRTVLPGDVLMKWPSGGLFVSDDPAVDQSRFESREVVIGGPMFGSRTFAAKAVAAEREAAILADHQVGPATFARFGKLVTGTRRHAQVYLDDLAAEWEPEGLRLSFSLPSGSYATVLLREIMKTRADAEEEPATEED